MKNNEPAVRWPAEWEPQGAVMVAWPHPGTDWAYMLADIEECYVRMVEAIARHAAVIVVAPDTSRARQMLSGVPGDILYFDTPTNDTWTRDYGPIVTRDADEKPVITDFGFNAWGGKFEAAADNGVTARMVAAGLLRGKYSDENAFILEGGSIESDGRGTVMTTPDCLLTPTRNPGMDRADIERKLASTLGARHILWVEGGGIVGDDTDGHIDTLARLCPDDTIMFVGHPTSGRDTDPQQAEMLDNLRSSVMNLRTPEGMPYNLLELPLPDPIYDEDGERLPATYANYLVINDAVLLPSYGQPQNDLLAERIVRVAYPHHIIERVDSRPLICQHGSLHCATMQLPKDVLPI